MPRISRYKLRNSDRSGFTFYEIQLVKDGPWKVGGEEFDQPPPSRKSLGGEGDVAGEPRANSSFADGVVSTNTIAGLDNPTIFITTSGITPSFTHPWMFVTGSNQAITITGTPSILRGREGQLLTLHCIDSSITLSQGSAQAITFPDSRGSLLMRSGMVVSFIYTTANQCWNATNISYY